MHRLFPVLILVVFAAAAAMAQEAPKPMEIDDLFTFSRIGSIDLAANGKYILFTESKSDWDINGTITQIWRVKPDGSDVIQLTRGDKSCSSPAWNPAGDKIAFLTSRSGDSQVWLMNNNGGEAWQMTKHSTNIDSFQWSPDGTTVYFTAPDPKTEEDEQREKDNNDVIVVDKNLKNVHLWACDLETREEKRLTDGDFSIRSFEVSPDDGKIAFIAGPTPKVDDNLKLEVYLIELSDNSVKPLTKNRITEGDLRWSPNGKFVTFVSDSSKDLETYYQSSIFLLKLDGSDPVDLLPDFEKEVISHEWAIIDGSPMILFSANTGVNVHFFAFDYTGSKILHQNTSKDGVRYSFDVEGDMVAFTFSDPYSPADVYFQKGFETTPIRITDMNPQISNFQKPVYKTIHWSASDGHTVEGLLILPPGYKEGTKYPMLVQLHGGPESSYKNAFSTSFASYPFVLAAKGYVLFQPNYRGSTGYGDNVMRAIIGRYFEDDIDDIITGIDYLVTEGIADPDRLGAMGWSAGGHLTNWLVTHYSERFKAAGSGAGMSNWFSFYAQTDMHYIREIWQTGPPYERPELFRDKSPINYIRNAKTPTIIFCGADDRRVPAPQSWEMYIGLQRYGVESEFRLYPGEPHGLRKLSHQKDKMARELAWFNEHILGIEETCATAEEGME